MNVNIPIVVRESTLADLIETLAGNERLSKTRRRDLICAVNTAARLANRRPEEIAANARELRERLARIHPTQANMTAKRLANVKSDLAAALKHVPAKRKVRIREGGYSTSWRAFRETLETDWQRYTLSRLTRYCSARRIPPERVSDELIGHFREHLDQTQIAKNPNKIAHITIQTWNGFVSRTVADLPLLTKPACRRFITRPLTDYPQSFRDNLQAWLDRLSQSAIFAENAPPKPLRPDTLRNIRASIRQFAHALVEQGTPIHSLTTLADLVRLDAYKSGLQYFYERNGNSPPTWLANMAGHLVAIAKYHVRVDTKELEQLRTLKARLAVESPGLTEKNKARLAQFEDTRNVDRLLALPEHLMRRAKASKRVSSRVALGVMYAVAVELLLACPIRVGNLARLNIETHFRWYGQGRSQRLAMVIPGSEVKNKEPVEVDLPQESMRLVKAYLADWRPLISDGPGDWLFPARGGGHRIPVHLSQEMSKVIFKHTGLRVNAHLFRHLAGMLYLIENPGEYETVRRLLGHRKMATTTTFYAPLENKQAVKRYDEAVLSKRRRT
jgi:integrase